MASRKIGASHILAGSQSASKAVIDPPPAEPLAPRRLQFKTAELARLRIFYREAGEPSKPTIVLLELAGRNAEDAEFGRFVTRG